MPTLTDRIVLTEKEHSLSGLFKRVGWYDNVKILLATKDAIIVLQVVNSSHLEIKSFVLLPEEVWSKARARWGYEMTVNGFLDAPQTEIKFKDGLRRTARIQLCLTTKLVPEIFSVSLNPDHIWTRSHGALLSLHLEACRSGKDLIFSLSTSIPKGDDPTGHNAFAVRKNILSLQAIKLGLDKIISTLTIT